MSLYLITALFEIICVAIVSYALPISDENGAALYLIKFGYLNETAYQRDQHIISTAIKDFQRFACLNETGQLNNDTIRLMNVPRCGVKDKTIRSQSMRKKRYALAGSKWPVKELTYHVSQHTSRIRDSSGAMNEIARAFKVWSDVTTLNFKEKQEGPADIDIRFVVGQHGDGDPFDGPGKILAHAQPPENGDAHFDDEEMWTLNERIGTNLFQVAAHQFGHSLGLLHSDVQSALMNPFYRGYIPGFQLHSNDIEGIQSLYGARYSPPPTDYEDDENLDTPSDTSDAPDLCQDATIDAITRTKSGSTYMFKGNFYWKLLGDFIAEGYPRKISDDWDGLEGNLDAAVTWSNGTTLFFKESRYWSFTNRIMDSGYPKFISVGLEGIPDNLDAALVWSGNGKTYFFKGDKYWRYDIDSIPSVNSNYPMSIREWSRFLATGIDAAFQWENRRTYLFKGDHYYRYNDNTSEIDDDLAYPLSTATYWFNCQ